ncbi:hypothetical protein HPP92_023819 [Vanilla planifolia]|uniref:Uncharacterized protein n=1 Tax=Vanilla planifolia TaxID=51239 RepID=A0A835PQU5_VANPL|nr:hypothetical protein HPP92_023819 [Vanilla planifolia]
MLTNSKLPLLLILPIKKLLRGWDQVMFQNRRSDATKTTGDKFYSSESQRLDKQRVGSGTDKVHTQSSSFAIPGMSKKNVGSNHSGATDASQVSRGIADGLEEENPYVLLNLFGNHSSSSGFLDIEVHASNRLLHFVSNLPSCFRVLQDNETVKEEWHKNIKFVMKEWLKAPPGHHSPGRPWRRTHRFIGKRRTGEPASRIYAKAGALRSRKDGVLWSSVRKEFGGLPLLLENVKEDDGRRRRRRRQRRRWSSSQGRGVSATELSKALGDALPPTSSRDLEDYKRRAAREDDDGWLKDNKERRRSEARTRGAQIYAAISVAGVAAVVAATASGPSFPRFRSIQVRGLLQGRRRHGLGSGPRGVSLHRERPGDWRQQTADPGRDPLRALRAAAILGARMKKETNGGVLIETTRKQMDAPQLLLLYTGGELLKRTRKGDLHWKQVSVCINSYWQVVVKMKSRCIAGTFCEEEKGAVVEVCSDVPPWPGRGEDGSSSRAYFGIRTLERLIEFECRSKCEKEMWVDESFIQLSERHTPCIRLRRSKRTEATWWRRKRPLPAKEGSSTLREKSKETAPLLVPEMEEKEAVAGYNKKRAEGRDKRNRTRTLQLKTRKLNPVSTTCYVQILGTGMDTQDTSPSVFLFFDKQRFIFNAGEGCSGSALSTKLNYQRLIIYSLRRVSSETTGGLPG